MQILSPSVNARNASLKQPSFGRIANQAEYAMITLAVREAQKDGVFRSDVPRLRRELCSITDTTGDDTLDAANRQEDLTRAIDAQDDSPVQVAYRIHRLPSGMSVSTPEKNVHAYRIPGTDMVLVQYIIQFSPEPPKETTFTKRWLRRAGISLHRLGNG